MIATNVMQVKGSPISLFALGLVFFLVDALCLSGILIY